MFPEEKALVRVDLPPRADREYRSAFWYPVMEIETIRIGLVVVWEGANKLRAKVTGRYSLTETPFEDGRRFRLTKSGGGEVYWIHRTKDGTVCDCPGYESHGYCKHSDALHWIIQSRRMGALTGKAVTVLG